MKGFANVATSLIQMLPALLALKGILMLASAGKAIQSLVTAVGLIQGKNNIPVTTPSVPPAVPVAPLTGVVSNFGKALSMFKMFGLLGVGTQQDKLGLSNDVVQKLLKDPNFSASEKAKLREQYGITNVTINVQGADPKTTVDALGKYLKQNGSLPFNLATVGKKP